MNVRNLKCPSGTDPPGHVCFNVVLVVLAKETSPKAKWNEKEVGIKYRPKRWKGDKET